MPMEQTSHRPWEEGIQAEVFQKRKEPAGGENAVKNVGKPSFTGPCRQRKESRKR